MAGAVADARSPGRWLDEGSEQTGVLTRRDWTACALLAAGALVIRAIGLDSGLWLDEINGILAWMRPPLSEILTVYKGDGQHPLYALLGHASILLFGEHAWSVRLPAALFGAATVPMLYVLGRRVASRREALFAAMLLAVSYHHVWFSQNARGYTILTFFVLVGTYFLVRGLNEGRKIWFIGYGIAMALGAYTHITVVFPAIAQFLVVVWVVWRQRMDWRAPLIGFATAAAITLLLYAPILKQVIEWFLFRSSNFEGISTPSWAIGEAVRILRRGVIGGASAAIGVVAIAAGGLVFMMGMISYARRSGIVFALMTLPFLTTFAGALLARATMYPRFFFFLLPFAILMIVRGLDQAGSWVMRRRGGRGSAPANAHATRDERLSGAAPAHGLILGSALNLAAIAAFALSLSANYRYPKQDFGGAVRYVERNRQPNEMVMVAGAATGPVQLYYERAWPEVRSPAAIDSLVGSGTAGYWLMYTFPRYIAIGAPDLMRRIDETCGEREVFPGTVGGGDIIVCRVTREPQRS
ncbi:MAG: glycosyltransferase family 39 protein [Longimicrobiales bacterium]